MYCKSCGAEIDERGKCSVCGKRASTLSPLLVIMCAIALIASVYAVVVTNRAATASLPVSAAATQEPTSPTTTAPRMLSYAKFLESMPPDNTKEFDRDGDKAGVLFDNNTNLIFSMNVALSEENIESIEFSIQYADTFAEHIFTTSYIPGYESWGDRYLRDKRWTERKYSEQEKAQIEEISNLRTGSVNDFIKTLIDVWVSNDIISGVDGIKASSALIKAYSNAGEMSIDGEGYYINAMPYNGNMNVTLYFE